MMFFNKKNKESFNFTATFFYSTYLFHSFLILVLFAISFFLILKLINYLLSNVKVPVKNYKLKQRHTTKNNLCFMW